MDLNPSKEDIEAVFHRLRAIPTNKVCFDCNAKNPTWSSVTYGIFICLDCSAVHRSLGVHLTFVRSTQLDTNWTWVQLRQMQLGGNANAMQFFSQHNCNTTDAQKKYNSRAAQLYKEKLQQIALNSLKTNKELHIHAHTTEEKESPKEVDFFTENEQFYVKDAPEQLFSNSTVKSVKTDPTEGPTVNLSQNHDAEPRKSTISARKPAAKKVGLGAKKGGLGATRVKTNFADLEKEASMAEEMKLKMAEEEAKEILVSAKNAEERDAAVRLAYKDISTQQQKAEEQMRKQDPKKAEQVERLGMGFGTRSGVSHSAMSDMRVIEQENVQSKNSTLSSLGKLRLSEDNFFDDFYSNSSKNDKTSSKDDESWVITDDPFEKYRNKNTYPSPVSSDKPKEKHRSVPSVSIPSGEESAQKKFGNAKAISSDQYFNNQTLDYETQTNLNRFQGSSSISSSEFFGNGQPEKRGISSSVGNSLQYYDVEDVKESVRQGVTKVAGKISSLANGVMSSIQDRYGY